MSATSHPSSASLSPRLIFDPEPAPTTAGPARAGGPLATVVAYYRDRLSWLALAVTAVVLAYGGGAVMFWFHAVQLGEGGPAISWYAHWLLDSTFGFLVLTPVLAVIIPLALRVGVAITGPGRRAVLTVVYAVLAGGVFALLTTPGPIAHDMVVGRGTWVAERVTALIGDPNAPLPPVQDYALPAALTQQLGAGVLVYLALTALSVLLVRGAVNAARMRVRPLGGRVTIDR